jgi:hypothetical protein
MLIKFVLYVAIASPQNWFYFLKFNLKASVKVVGKIHFVCTLDITNRHCAWSA